MPILKPVKIKKLHISSSGASKTITSSFKSIGTPHSRYQRGNKSPSKGKKSPSKRRNN